MQPRVGAQPRAWRPGEMQPRVGAQPRASQLDEMQPRVAPQPDASALDEMQPRVAAQPRASQLDEMQPRVAAQPRASQLDEMQPRVAAQPRASALDEMQLVRVSGETESYAPAQCAPSQSSDVQEFSDLLHYGRGSRSEESLDLQPPGLRQHCRERRPGWHVPPRQLKTLRAWG